MASVVTPATFPFEKCKYVAGIDFGSTTSGFSIAHVNDSRKILTVKKWNGNITKDRNANKPNAKVKQMFTSLLYKGGDRNNVFCGITDDDSLDNETNKEAEDIYISNIKQYLFDPLGNENLNAKLPGLTVAGVVTDFFKAFVKKASDRLKEESALEGKNCLEKDFQPEKIIYCINSSKEHEDILRRCFIDAGLIQESEANDRLRFLSDAEATAYHCLAWDRFNSGVIAGEEYLVCDIGHRSVEIGAFIAETTEYLSTASFVASKPGIGSIALDNNLRNYLVTQDLTEKEIEAKLVRFNNKKKFRFDYKAADIESLSITETNTKKGELSDLEYNTHVFMPAVNEIIASIVEADDQGGRKYKKIFLSGKYSTDGYFLEKLSDNGRFSKSIKLLEHEPIHAVSAGAVSYGFRKKPAQIPYFSQSENATSKKVVTEDTSHEQKLVECDFIVGIDFGTTYSGASYIHKPKNKSHGNADEIKVITTWPKQKNNNQVEKAPTLIVYDGKKLTKIWGQKAREQTLKGDNLLFGNFKLFLAPERVTRFYGEDSKIANIREKYTLDKIKPLDVITTYLRNFKEHVEAEIKSKEYGILEKIAKRPVFGYVLTVPAMWDRQAKDLMIKAALDAGIANGNRDHLIVITEPEAAALNCEREFQTLLGKESKTFIVCDAGGGTVDLVTFQIKKDDVENKSRIYQIEEGRGGTCGSSYLDENFKKYILAFYARLGLNISEGNIDLRDVMMDFIDRIKPTFSTSQSNDTYKITLPFRPEIPSSMNTNGRTINNNRILVIKYEDMKKIFDDVFKEIFDILDEQIQKAKESDHNIDAILMVGGFSKSEYLEYCIRQRYSSQNIQVGVPPEPVIAVAKGAVSYALNPRMISSTHVGQSYALEVKTKFINTQDDPAKRIKDATGMEYIKSSLVYFVKKREELDVNDVIAYEKNVYVEYPHNAVIAIFSLDQKVINESKDEFRFVGKDHKKIMEVQVNMPYLPKRKDNDKIPFTISLQLDSNGVKVDVSCKDIAQKISAEHKCEDTLIYSGKSEPIILQSRFFKGLYALS